jgi:murein L,D-transpeptidase YcbB/YkuD
LAAPVSLPVAGPLAGPHPAVVRHDAALERLLASNLARPGVDPELVAFYAARADTPLWIDRGRVRPEARQLVAMLRASGRDELNPADYQPGALEAQVRAAASGRRADLVEVELALSQALGAWGAELHRARPGAGMLYSDPQLAPPAKTRRAALETVGRADSLQEGLAAAAQMNPLYEGLRQALADEQARGGANTAVIRANLERARALPVDLGRRYIFVDVTAQRLWTYQDGRPVFSMKVVVGKPSEPTPQMAALVRYAVFRPYWNVPPDLVEAGVAPKVLRQGLSYFHNQHLEALSDWSDNATTLDPAKVNWRAVAQGRQELRVRQLPGPGNMMGRVKFMFPNERGVYLHDSPLRALFTGDQRLGSAGCVRLEDAEHLARWLLGDVAVAQGERPGPPETRAALAQPVPVYIVYLTATPTTGGLSLRRDFYRRDPRLIAQLPTQAKPTQLASR